MDSNFPVRPDLKSVAAGFRARAVKLRSQADAWRDQGDSQYADELCLVALEEDIAAESIELRCQSWGET